MPPAEPAVATEGDADPSARMARPVHGDVRRPPGQLEGPQMGYGCREPAGLGRRGRPGRPGGENRQAQAKRDDTSVAMK
jgi:hypothetical protein